MRLAEDERSEWGFESRVSEANNLNTLKGTMGSL
jgi:hypothetical protein